MPQKIPNFTFCFSNPYHSNFGYISVDGHAVDLLADCNEVYKHLGYTADMAKAGILPDEFIWHEYTKDGAAQSLACMQARIIEYLHAHSEIFKEKYGNAYKTWAESCSSRKVGESAACANCRMYPKHETTQPAATVDPIQPNKLQDTPALARYNFLKMASALGVVDT